MALRLPISGRGARICFLQKMSYRPITDMWILARAKLKPYPDGSKRSYYGAYLGGFVERARVLVGCSINAPVLHVCGGMAKHYPYKAGYGPNDRTLDIDPACEPDFLQDARGPLPGEWAGIICDPPYSLEDAAKYTAGAACYPSPGGLVANAILSVPIGHRVGMLHYMLPRCPKNAKFIALVGVVCGFNNRIRCFSVFQREF